MVPAYFLLFTMGVISLCEILNNGVIMKVSIEKGRDLLMRNFGQRAGVLAALVLLLAAFVLALPQTFAKNCSPVLPHSGLKFGTVRDAKL